MLLLALIACDSEKAEGPFALAFDGAPDCVEMPTDGAAPGVFTVELWMRGEPDPSDKYMPFVVWPGVFSLGEERGGTVVYSVGDAGAGSVSWATSLMDGVVHHVMGTFDGEGLALFVDGKKVGLSDATLGTASDTLRVGCSGDDESFEGVLDEVRISTLVRRTDDFARPTEPFRADTDTYALLHFDEGEGDVTVDEVSGAEGAVEGAEWIPFEVPAS